MKKSLHILALLAFITTTVLPAAQAQQIFLPPPGTMVGISPGYAPLAIRGLKIYPDDPFKFDFILDTGDSKLEGEKLQKETNLLVKYFLAALTVPDNDQWVNLSPYEKDRIIPDQFGATEMGRDLLAQDYLLKQLTASLIYPEHDLGKKFWERVYQKASDKYGDVIIPVSTFNKVWIMPDHAHVYESGSMAVITESHLKVLLEEDYEALKNNGQSVKTENANKLASEIIRDIVLPEIEKEVNEGRNFSKLRQVYQSMIMAAWFKRKLKNGILDKMYIGTNNVAGVEIEDKDEKQKIYDQYLAAFKKGVYNYIKEEYNEKTNEMTPRKYFSGGFMGGATVASSTVFSVVTKPEFEATLSNFFTSPLKTAFVYLKPRFKPKGAVGNASTARPLRSEELRWILPVLSMRQIIEHEAWLSFFQHSSHRLNDLVGYFPNVKQAFGEERFDEFLPRFLEIYNMINNHTAKAIMFSKILPALAKHVQNNDDLKRFMDVLNVESVYRREHFPTILFDLDAVLTYTSAIQTPRDLEQYFRMYERLTENFGRETVQLLVGLKTMGEFARVEKDLEQWKGREGSVRVVAQSIPQIWKNDNSEGRYPSVARMGREVITTGVSVYTYYFSLLFSHAELTDSENIVPRDFLTNTAIDFKVRMSVAPLIYELLGLHSFAEMARQSLVNNPVNSIAHIREFVDPNADDTKELLAEAEEINGKIAVLAAEMAQVYDETRTSIFNSLVAIKTLSNSKQRKKAGQIETSLVQLRLTAFKFLIGRQLTAKEEALLNDPVLKEKILTIMSIMGTLDSTNFRERSYLRDMIKTALQKLLDHYNSEDVSFATAEAHLNQLLFTLPPMPDGETTKGIIPSNLRTVAKLKAAGYSEKLWSEGIVFETQVAQGMTAEIKSANIRKAADELVEIASDGLGLAEVNEQPIGAALNKIDTYVKAQEFVDGIVKAKTEIDPRLQASIRRILFYIQEQETIKVGEIPEVARFRVTAQKNFLNEALAGLGVPGCYHPTGVHREAPLLRALEADAMLIQVYDEDGRQVANAEMVFTNDGAYVYSIHNSSMYDLDATFGKAIARLSEYVPQIILDPTSAGYTYLSGYTEAAATKLKLLKPPIYFRDFYFDNMVTDDDWNLVLEIPNPLIINKDKILAKDGKLDKEDDLPPPTLIVPVYLDYQQLAQAMIGAGQKEFLFLVGELKNRVAREGKTVIDAKFYDWVYRIAHASVETLTEQQSDAVADTMLDFLESQDWAIDIDSAQAMEEGLENKDGDPAASSALIFDFPVFKNIKYTRYDANDRNSRIRLRHRIYIEVQESYLSHIKATGIVSGVLENSVYHLFENSIDAILQRLDNTADPQQLEALISKSRIKLTFQTNTETDQFEVVLSDTGGGISKAQFEDWQNGKFDSTKPDGFPDIESRPYNGYRGVGVRYALFHSQAANYTVMIISKSENEAAHKFVQAPNGQKTVENYTEVLHEVGTTISIAGFLTSSGREEKTASAPAAEAAKPQNLGGIDMNSNALDLETSGKGGNFNTTFDPAQFQNIQIDGFTPMILQILPANLPRLLSEGESQKDLQVSSR